MAEHILKCWPNAFDAIANGRRRFEWRRDDRGFEVGDVLRLQKFYPHPLDESQNPFPPPTIRVRVTYILRGMFGIPDGFCVMSVEPAPTDSKPSESGRR